MVLFTALVHFPSHSPWQHRPLCFSNSGLHHRPPAVTVYHGLTKSAERLGPLNQSPAPHQSGADSVGILKDAHQQEVLLQVHLTVNVDIGLFSQQVISSLHLLCEWGWALKRGRDEEVFILVRLNWHFSFVVLETSCGAAVQKKNSMWPSLFSSWSTFVSIMREPLETPLNSKHGGRVFWGMKKFRASEIFLKKQRFRRDTRSAAWQLFIFPFCKGHRMSYLIRTDFPEQPEFFKSPKPFRLLAMKVLMLMVS